MNSITNLSAKQLRKAANLKDRIAQLQKDLSKLLGSKEAAPKRAPNKRRPMSKAARAKIAASARKRWKKAKEAGKKTL